MVVSAFGDGFGIPSSSSSSSTTSAVSIQCTTLLPRLQGLSWERSLRGEIGEKTITYVPMSYCYYATSTFVTNIHLWPMAEHIFVARRHNKIPDRCHILIESSPINIDVTFFLSLLSWFWSSKKVPHALHPLNQLFSEEFLFQIIETIWLEKGTRKTLSQNKQNISLYYPYILSVPINSLWTPFPISF